MSFMKLLLNEKNKRCLFESIGTFILFALITYALNKANCQPFQLLIDSWFYAACSLLLAGVLIMRFKSANNKWAHIVVACAYYGYAINYLITHNDDYGYQYRNYLIFQFISRGLFLLILVDVIFSKELVRINSQNRWYVMICTVAVGIAIALNYVSAVFILFPLGGLLLTNISATKWNKLMLSLSAGYYSMWAALMTKSLIQHPYGDTGRYYAGNFGAPTSAALITVGAFVSAIYLLEGLLKWSIDDCKRTIKTVAICVVAACLLYACIAISMIGIRSGQLAVIVTTFIYILLYNNNTAPEKIRKRRIWMLTVAGGIVAAFIILAIILAHVSIDWDGLAQMMPGTFLKNKVSFLGIQIESLNHRSSYAGVIPEGSVWNAIDRLSADRISIWCEHIKHMNLWGTEDIAVLYGNGPHSVYIWILRKFGWIGGIPLCSCLVISGIISARRVSQRESEYMCSLLWIIAFLSFGLTDQIPWQYSMGLFFLIMQYPLIIEMDKSVKDYN